jgi:epoxyqueuosine reductase
MNKNETAWTEIRKHIEAAGFAHYGCARLERPVSIDFYRQWLDAGFHGEMQYLERHFQEKEDPKKILPRARSAIVVTESYFPHPYSRAAVSEHRPLKAAQIALYAKGEDYHIWLKAKLSRLAGSLKAWLPNEEFVVFTDSSPVLERDLAARSGLGWVGKNTCLIHPKRGSLFFIGEVYTSLDLDQAQISFPDHCGTCTRCLDVCPTGALENPRNLDARKCISYLTIETKSVPPESLRPGIGDWLFGCDLCQTVCPWNLKVHGKGAFAALTEGDNPKSTADLIEDLRFILSSSNKQLERNFRGTALSRAGAVGLKKNALIVCANLRLRELRDEVIRYVEHRRLGELACWTLKQFD